MRSAKRGASMCVEHDGTCGVGRGRNDGGDVSVGVERGDGTVVGSACGVDPASNWRIGEGLKARAVNSGRTEGHGGAD